MLIIPFQTIHDCEIFHEVIFFQIFGYLLFGLLNVKIYIVDLFAVLCFDADLKRCVFIVDIYHTLNKAFDICCKICFII